MSTDTLCTALIVFLAFTLMYDLVVAVMQYGAKEFRSDSTPFIDLEDCGDVD